MMLTRIIGKQMMMLNKKDRHKIRQFFCELMGKDFWDNLYNYQKIYLYYTPDILQTIEYYNRLKNKKNGEKK